MAKQKAEDRARDELAQTPPREFIAARNRLAAELKEQGEDAASKVIKQLKKPSASVWGINALSREAKDVLAALLEAGSAVRLAQRKALSGAGEHGLRGATSTLHAEVGRATHAVELILADAGEKPSSAVMERVRSTLLSGAIGEDDVRGALRDGTLEEDLSPAGFGVVAPLRVVSAQARTAREKKPAPAPKKEPEGPTHAELKRHRDVAKAELVRRRKTAQGAEKERARLEQLAASMEERARDARERAEAAAKEAREMAGARKAAERALAEAEAALSE